VGDVPPVIGVGRSPGGDHADQVAGDDDVRRCPAYPALGAFILKGADAARTHVAVAAAYAQLTKPALRLHGLQAIPCRFYPQRLSDAQHFLGGGIDASLFYFPAVFFHGFNPRGNLIYF
jgi:hypothetical protein